MDHNMQYQHITPIGTISGTLLVFFNEVQTSEITKTITLSVIGAVVSFLVSASLKFLLRKQGEK